MIETLYHGNVYERRGGGWIMRAIHVRQVSRAAWPETRPHIAALTVRATPDEIDGIPAQPPSELHVVDLRARLRAELPVVDQVAEFAHLAQIARGIADDNATVVADAADAPPPPTAVALARLASIVRAGEAK